MHGIHTDLVGHQQHGHGLTALHGERVLYPTHTLRSLRGIQDAHMESVKVQHMVHVAPISNGDHHRVSETDTHVCILILLGQRRVRAVDVEQIGHVRFRDRG